MKLIYYLLPVVAVVGCTEQTNKNTDEVLQRAVAKMKEQSPPQVIVVETKPPVPDRREEVFQFVEQGFKEQRQRSAHELLRQATAYANGTPPQEMVAPAMDHMERRGFRVADGQTQQFILMVLARDICDALILEYPKEPEAIAAAKLRNEIHQQLEFMVEAKKEFLFKMDR
ncbi:MAG TPA: hypothetical protein VGH19_18635 [Verrucomicrobiae bacterium]